MLGWPAEAPFHQSLLDHMDSVVVRASSADQSLYRDSFGATTAGLVVEHACREQASQMLTQQLKQTVKGSTHLHGQRCVNSVVV